YGNVLTHRGCRDAGAGAGAKVVRARRWFRRPALHTTRPVGWDKFDDQHVALGRDVRLVEQTGEGGIHGQPDVDVAVLLIAEMGDGARHGDARIHDLEASRVVDAGEGVGT